MEVSDELHAPAVLSPVPIGMEARWITEPVYTLLSREKSVASAGNRS
jgi:hypothetical protein